MKSRRNLLLAALGIAATVAALGFDRAAAILPAKVATTAVVTTATVATAPATAPAANREAAPVATREAPAAKAGDATADSSGELPRMRVQASRDLFAGKSWVVAPPPPPPPKPVAPPLPYAFSGSMRDAGGAGDVVLFIKAGNRNFIVRKGDTVGSAYRLDDITDKQAVFTYLPLQQQQSLAIGNTN
jgi:hypothetical protein